MFLKIWTVLFLIITVYAEMTTRPNDNKERSLATVGALYTSINKFPFAVAILYLNIHTKITFSCGGSILTRKTVLTAAHCWSHWPKKHLIRYGHQDYTKAPYEIDIIDIRKHKKHNKPVNCANDIALAFLQRDIYWGNLETIPAVKIYRQYPSKVKTAYLTGWGSITGLPDDNAESYLKYEKLDIQHQEMCKKICHGLAMPWFPSFICILKMIEEPERGDSGGALVIKGFNQIGIFSFVKPKVSEDSDLGLVVLTNVTFYHEWLVHHARQ